MKSKTISLFKQRRALEMGLLAAIVFPASLELLFHAGIVRAQASCASVAQILPPTDVIMQTVQLSPPISEQRGNANPVGRIHQQIITINIPIGSSVWLSGSKDGRAGLCTDDLVEIVVNTTGKHWRHDFRSADGNRIVPIAPVDVTDLFDPGENVITLTLTDLKEPAYSSSAYYIVVLAPVATETPTASPSPTTTTLATATATSTDTRMPTPTLSATPSATATEMPTKTNTPTPTSPATPTATNTTRPKPTVTTLPSATPTMTRQALSLPMVTAGTNQAAKLPMLPSFVLAALLGGVLLLAAWSYFRQQPRLSGELNVWFDGQHVATHSLDGQKKAIVIDNQGQQIASGQPGDNAAIRIYPRRTDRGTQVLADQLVGGEVRETYALQHGDEIQAGELRLHYENYVQMELEFDNEEPNDEFSNR